METQATMREIIVLWSPTIHTYGTLSSQVAIVNVDIAFITLYIPTSYFNWKHLCGQLGLQNTCDADVHGKEWETIWKHEEEGGQVSPWEVVTKAVSTLDGEKPLDVVISHSHRKNSALVEKW